MAKKIAKSQYKVTVPGVGLITPDGVLVTAEQVAILKNVATVIILDIKKTKDGNNSSL